MKALAVLIAAAALVVAATAPGRATTAAPACIKVRVGSTRVCLAAGTKCTAKYAAVYKAHGFQCRNGRLARVPKQAPIGTVTAKIAIPAYAVDEGLQVGEGAVWALGVLGGDSSIFRIDPSANAVTETIPTAALQDYPPWFAVGDGSVWISNFTDNTVWRVDAATGSRVATISTPLAPEGITVAPSGVWVATHHGNPTGSVTRIDPSTNTVVGRTAVGAVSDCCGPQGLSATGSGVWTTVPNLNGVARVDPASGALAATIPANPACGNVAATDSAVWVMSSCGAGLIYRIDPATNKIVATIHVDGNTDNVAVGAGAIWVLTHSTDPNLVSGALVRIDPATNRVVGSMALADPAGVVVLGNDVYVGNSKAVWRITPT